MLTDPIADMLSRIRNANKALHEKVLMPTSKMKVEIARLLKEEGYIRDYHVEKGESFDTLVIDLKFGRTRERVISGLKRVSTPGRRVYARKDRLPRVLGGMGVAILSTSSGLVTSRTAQERGIGGEVGCFIWGPPEQNWQKTHRASHRRQRLDRSWSRRGDRSAWVLAAAGSGAHADRAGGRHRDRHAADGARRGSCAARAYAPADRKHGRGRHQGLREASRDPGRRLPRFAQGIRSRAKRRLLAHGGHQAAHGCH